MHKSQIKSQKRQTNVDKEVIPALLLLQLLWNQTNLKINFSHPLLPDPCTRTDRWSGLHMGWALSHRTPFHGHQKLRGENSWQLTRRAPKIGWVPCACLSSPFTELLSHKHAMNCSCSDIYEQHHRGTYWTTCVSVLEAGLKYTSKAQPQSCKKENKNPTKQPQIQISYAQWARQHQAKHQLWNHAIRTCSAHTRQIWAV